MAAVQAGGDRQRCTRSIPRTESGRVGGPASRQANPLAELLAADERITQFVPADAVPGLLDASGHVGDAAERALALAAHLRSALTPASTSMYGTSRVMTHDSILILPVTMARSTLRWRSCRPRVRV